MNYFKYFKDEFNIEEIDVHKFEMLCPNDEIKELCLSLIKINPECDRDIFFQWCRTGNNRNLCAQLCSMLPFYYLKLQIII